MYATKGAFLIFADCSQRSRQVISTSCNSFLRAPDLQAHCTMANIARTTGVCNLEKPL